MLKKLVLSLAIVGAMLVPLVCGTPAFAQASRTWVSGVGDDANPCSRTAPCKTFAGAISKTAVGGEINCLDPGGFGAVTITKSITIDCHEVFGSVLVSGTNGININADNSAAPVVRLRNLNITGITGLGITGITINGATTSNTVVVLEDIMIDGFNTRGISDTRTGGGKLLVSNTSIRDTGGATGSCIGLFPSSGSTRVDVVLDRVFVRACGTGLGVGGSAMVMVTNSVFSGNAASGIEVDSGQANINSSVISSNGTNGILRVGGTVVISNSDIFANGTGISGLTSSFVTNRISGNTSAGTLPTPIGSPTSAAGQE